MYLAWVLSLLVLLTMAGADQNQVPSPAPGVQVVQRGNTLTASPMQPPAGGGGVQTKQPVVQQTSIGSDYDDSEPAPGEKESWPELVNLDCQNAKSRIEAETSGKSVYIVQAGTAVTLDYRTDRVRIICDQNGIVSKAPTLG